MTTETIIILASSSTYRQQQLKQLGLKFQSQSPNIEEEAKPGEKIQDTTERLSLQKALRIQEQNPNAVIIGSDQSAELDGATLSKPMTPQVAFEQLSRCSGRRVYFYTGLCVLSPNQSPQLTSVTTEVTFRTLNDKQIRAYIQKESPLNCAGSFKCEGLGIALFKTIKSDDPSALIGLPLIMLNQLLLNVGIDALTA